MKIALLVCLAYSGVLPGGEDYIRGDAAKRAGRFEEAAAAFRACADSGAALYPFAMAEVAACLAGQGDNEGAAALYRAVLEAQPHGPWARMIDARLAALYASQKQYAKAAPHFSRVLDVQPRPWWMDAIGWDAAENALEIPATASQAYAWYREIIESTLYTSDRRDAARKLLGSPLPDDKMRAISGLLRAGNYTEAGKALLGAASYLEANASSPSPLADLTRLISKKAEARIDAAAKVAEFAVAHPQNPWLRLWLIYALRTQASYKRFDEASATCDLLVAQSPAHADSGHARYWLARYMDREGKPPRAITEYAKVVSEFPEHVRADDAQMRIAEIELDAGNKEAAIEAFVKLGRDYPESRFRQHAFYTAARLRAKEGDRKLERLYYAYAAHEGFGVYHAHRALQRLFDALESDAPPQVNLAIDGTRPVLQPFPSLRPRQSHAATPPVHDERLERLRFLGANGLEAGEWDALGLLLTLDERAASGPYYHALVGAGFAHTTWQFLDARQWGVRNGKKSPERLRLDYPLAYWDTLQRMTAGLNLDPYLILAVVRQESTFRAGVRSHAGATGLLQVMPSTAKWLAKVDGRIGWDRVANLKHPENSLRLGAVYLRRMLDRSKGNIIHALASYNAGPGNCDKWRKRYPKHGVDEFIEAIPFYETRHYVKKVLANYAAYHSLYAPR